MSNLANLNLREVLDGRKAFARPTSSADSIEVECTQPTCRGRFRAKATALGKKINCPICGCGVVVQKASGAGEVIQPAPLPVNGTAAPAADLDAERRQKLLQQHEAARTAKAEAQRRQAVKERLQAEQAAQLAAEHERKTEATRRAEEERREELRRTKEARRQAEAALQQQQKEEELAAERKAETQRRHEEQRRRETALKAEAERQLKAKQAKARAEAESRHRAQEEMKAAEARRQAEVARRQAEAEVRRKTKEEALRLAKEEQIRRQVEAAQAAERRRQEAWDRRAALFETLAARSNAEIPSDAPHSAAFQDRYAGQLAASRHAFLGWQQAGALERRKAFENLVAQELRRWRLEHAMAANPETGGLAMALPRTRFLGGLAAFLLAPLEVRFCGAPVATALGLLNPYRLAGVSAQLPLPELSPLLQQAKEAAQRGEQSSVGVGLEWIVPTRQVFRKFQARQWRTPTGRLLAQLTWVHLGEFSQHILLQTQELTSELFVEYLAQEHLAANEDEAVLLRHALAVCWLHIAIAREAAFAAGRVNNALGYWDLAMECWAETMVDDRWWEYLRQQNNNGPVDEAREAFPLLLGGWIGRFARAYGERGDSVSCQRLLSVMRRSRLPDFVRNQGALAVVRGSFY